MQAISSPCINVCVPERGTCVGCGRTLDEIERWPRMSEPQRKAVMDSLDTRMRVVLETGPLEIVPAGPPPRS